MTTTVETKSQEANDANKQQQHPVLDTAVDIPNSASSTTTTTTTSNGRSRGFVAAVIFFVFLFFFLLSSSSGLFITGTSGSKAATSEQQQEQQKREEQQRMQQQQAKSQQEEREQQQQPPPTPEPGQLSHDGAVQMKQQLIERQDVRDEEQHSRNRGAAFRYERGIPVNRQVSKKETYSMQVQGQSTKKTVRKTAKKKS